MRLRYSRQALADLDAAREFITGHSPKAAAAMASLIRSSINGLTLFPDRGRPGRIPGTRELVIPTTPFIVAYRLRDHQIEILALIHGARRWPESF